MAFIYKKDIFNSGSVFLHVGIYSLQFPDIRFEKVLSDLQKERIHHYMQM